MERTFDAHVDGYYDVEDQFPRSLWRLAEKTFSNADEKRAAVDSVEAFETYRDRVRNHFFDAIGGLPDERTPLNPTVTGRIEREGYVVERVLFESIPNHHVTANCYLPVDYDGERPAVLLLCGHSDAGKIEPLYQQACIDLVRNGMVTLVIDPLGQGERHQFYNPKTGEYARRTTTEHTHLNQPYTFAGANVARHFIWDGIRAVDYLVSRSEVDPEAIGVTGNSGGGTQTAYMMLADERFAAASPNCFITSREEYMPTGQPQDGEQILYGATKRGPRYDDFLSAFAPKPVRIGAAQWDYFCVEGAKQSFERAERIYALYDAAENIDITLAADTHGYSRPLREAAVNWFREHLCGSPPDFEAGAPEVEDPETLWCTDEGEVKAAFTDERTVPELTREYVEQNAPDTDATVDSKTVREAVVNRFNLDRERGDVFPRRIAEESVGGLSWEKIFFLSEDDLVVTAVGVRDPMVDLEEGTPTVVLYEEGTDEVPERESELADLASESGYALAFDFRGIGGVRARDVNVHDYDGYHGTAYKLSSDALLLGTSVLGMQVFDVLRAADYLTGRFGDDVDLGIRGYDAGAVRALYAAVAEPSFRAVAVEDVPSFRERAVSPPCEYDPWLTVYDVLGECDLPQLTAALGDRDFTWVK
jgi:dienelactone hydrolase